MGAYLWYMQVASFFWFVDNVCGGEEKVKGLTTAEVCERYVKPYVSKHKDNPPEGSSAARLIEIDSGFTRDPEAEGTAAFISHSWHSQFMHTIETIYSNLGPKALVWMDLFSYNQFSPEVSDFGWWTSLLFETIRSCEKCVLLCDLTDLNLDSNPCNRLWCLFETFIAVQVNKSYEVWLTAETEEAVKYDLNGWSNQLLHFAVDINTAQCAVAKDKKNILSQIKVDTRDAFNASVSFIIKEQFHVILALLGAPVERWGPYLESIKLSEESTVADHGRYRPDVVPLFSVPDPLDLIEASESGNYSKVKELLKKGALIHGIDEKGQTALHTATTYKIASYLIHAKADVNLKDIDRGLTPLHTAKNFQVTKALIEKDAEINATDNQGWTPLHCAAGLPASDLQKGPGITDALLAANADVEAVTAEGLTALHRAAELGRKDVVEALLAAKADVNARDSETGATPLHRARKSKVVIALIAGGADVHATTTDETAETALHRAAERGDAEMAVALIAGRAKVNAKDGTRWARTALHRAAKDGHSEAMMDTLIAVKADVNLPEEQTGDTPSTSYMPPPPALLLVPPRFSSYPPVSPPRACCQTTYTESGVVEVLVKLKARVDVKNKLGQTALHKAAKESHSEEVIDTLCQARADVNVKDDLAGETPLHAAASQETYTELEVAEALLAASADVNARSYAGVTPLDKAIAHCSQTNDTAEVQALLKRHGGVLAHQQARCTCALS